MRSAYLTAFFVVVEKVQGLKDIYCCYNSQTANNALDYSLDQFLKSVLVGTRFKLINQ